MLNTVYIATSLDGYISDKNGSVDWLHCIDNPEASDFGFADFMAQVDALIMGRNTFEMVLSFDCDWPYSKPVFVLSNTLTEVPKGYEDKVFLAKGELTTILNDIHQQGYHNLYIDGGITIQSFLKEDLIDQLIVTTVPVLLGGGTPLFTTLKQPLQFKLEKTECLINTLVKTTFRRLR